MIKWAAKDLKANKYKRSAFGMLQTLLNCFFIPLQSLYNIKSNIVFLMYLQRVNPTNTISQFIYIISFSNFYWKRYPSEAESQLE